MANIVGKRELQSKELIDSDVTMSLMLLALGSLCVEVGGKCNMINDVTGVDVEKYVLTLEAVYKE